MFPTLLTLVVMVIVVWELNGWKMLGGLFVTLWAGGLASTWIFRRHVRAAHPGQIVRRASRVTHG
jgi:hypothetical protein